MKKLFESKKSNNSRGTRCKNYVYRGSVDSIWTNFVRQILFQKTVMVFNKILRMGIQKHWYKKHETAVGSDSININFLGFNIQFDWLELSLVFDKSNKHNNLWQLQCWISGKIHQICKADKLCWNIQPDKWKK